MGMEQVNFSSLFLQQSYIDSTKTYQDILNKKADILWDYIVLTASNEKQAEYYRTQINYRLENKFLPKNVNYLVVSDPNGLRVGSGGATLNVLREIHKLEDNFEDKRILIIHSGGDSKRVPQYSAVGKLFSPVPRVLPNGRRSTLFDEFMIMMAGVAGRVGPGMLVCSGDVLLLFNPLQIDFYGPGAAALSIKKNVEIGKNHGVFLSKDKRVGQFLHKKTSEYLKKSGAVDESNNVDIDTGAVIFDTNIVNKLYSLVDTEEKFNACVNEKVRLSFYADFLFPLATDATLEQYYLEEPEGEFNSELHEFRTKLWHLLNEYDMKLIRMSPAAFIHFGTTSELLKLMTEGINDYKYLDWRRHIQSNSNSIKFSSSNSYINPSALIGENVYIEDSYIGENVSIGNNSIVSGVTLTNQIIPENVVIHGLKLKNNKFVVRVYGIDDNPKEKKLFGKNISVPLWEYNIYPISDSINQAVDNSLKLVNETEDDSQDLISLKESFAMSNLSEIIPWQNKMVEIVKLKTILEAIENKRNLQNVLEQFYNGISNFVKDELLKISENLDETNLDEFSKKIRIYYVLSYLNSEYLNKSLETITNSVLDGALKNLSYDSNAKLIHDLANVSLPVRVNWGGGWSDTPPYCMEFGGTVLNAAIKLNDELPIRVVAKKLKVNKIVLASKDIEAEKEFTDIKELQDSSNPYDPYALHKAALIACGIIPLNESISLEDVLRHLGGGLYLSTEVINIPRGSGLGTSSILAGACVKALFEITGKQVTSKELYDYVLCMEQLMSTGGGWQDQVGGLMPGIKMISSSRGMKQNLTCTPINISNSTLLELNERFTLIYSGQRRLARNLLRDIVGSYINGTEDVVSVLYEIQQIATLMRFEFEKGNIDKFAELLNKHWELSKKLDNGCTNTCIDMIFHSIEDLIDGKMICGAGGGGFLQVIKKKGVTDKQLSDRLRDVFQDSGVEVWKSNFI